MTKYLHTMIRVSDPDATIDFFKLIGPEKTVEAGAEKFREVVGTLRKK